MKVKVRKRRKRNIIIPSEIFENKNVRVVIETNQNCSNKPNTNKKEQKRQNLLISIMQVLTTRAKNLVTKEQDGALTARILSSSLMRLAGWSGYVFAIYLPIGTVCSLVENFKEWNWQFIYQSTSSIIVSIMIAIFTAILGKGLMVDAIKLEENQKVEQIYGIATLIATVLIGILTLSQ